jgi:hypothetical protein
MPDESSNAVKGHMILHIGTILLLGTKCRDVLLFLAMLLFETRKSS